MQIWQALAWVFVVACWFSLSSGLSGFKAEPACFDAVSCFSLQLEYVLQCKPGHAMYGSPQVIKNGQHHEH